MAGDWIKMRCNLSSHPKVVKLASRLSVTRVTVIGALHAVWTVADQHASADGVLEMDADSLDAFAETPGFCRELEAVGWHRKSKRRKGKVSTFRLFRPVFRHWSTLTVPPSLPP